MLKSLMSLLLSLFYSKKESSLVSNQAMPSGSGQIVMTVTEPQGNWQDVISYIAPFDGYATGRVTGTGINSAELYTSSVRATMFSPVDHGQFNACIPVAKGQKVAIISTTYYEARLIFSKTIGSIGSVIGGGLSFIQLLCKGLPCLKSGYSFLQRSSLPTRKSGLANNQLEANFSRLSRLQRTVNTIISLCRAQAMQFCVVTELLILTLTGAFSSTGVRQQTLISLEQCTQRKVRTLLTLFGLLRISLPQTYESTKRKVPDNSLIGGAL